MNKTRKKKNINSWRTIPSANKDIHAQIDLRAIQHNFNYFKKRSGTDIMPVLKGDAYGHGIVPVASFLRGLGVQYIGVATLGEAILLRKNGDKGRIISWLYHIRGKEIKDALSLGLDITLFDESHLPILRRMIPKKGKVKITVFVDTGINRAGIPYDHAWDVCCKIAADERFEFVGLMSHLVCSQKKNNRIVLNQLRMFRELRDRLADHGITPPLVHIANSDACINYDVSDFTLSRVGWGIYGLSTTVPLQLAMSLTTTIIQLKDIQKGDGVGYDWTFIAPRSMRIAILPIGYADIIPRCIDMMYIFMVQNVEY